MVKEATALAEEGYRVIVLYNYWAEWAMKYDEEIKKRFPQIEWIETGGNPETAKRDYFFSRMRHKAYRLLYRYFPGNLYLAPRAEIRGFQSLLTCAEKTKANLYVAHNLGALPVAAKAAAKHKSHYAFDAEDFHRGQVTEKGTDYNRIVSLEDAYLANASYITAASPLIAEQYEEKYNRRVITVNNVFSKKNTISKTDKGGQHISLFWFSQTIGTGRGLEDIFNALALLSVEKFTLHLLGNISKEIKQYFDFLSTGANGFKIGVTYINPVDPDEIIDIAAKCDIGLALEPGRDINNQYALSNKIFTYLIAGNAIIFSSTPAQRKFYKENRNIGSLYTPGNAEELAGILNHYLENPAILAMQKNASMSLANEKYNWEIERAKFLSTVKNVLS
jgi:glycosyltransferase involved in cell wall biosynthesis